MPDLLHPVQTKGGIQVRARISALVTARAYEVYCKLYGAQEALVTGDCRGGFSAGELIAFLYAHSFPPEEWRDRFKEAVEEMEGL